MFPRVRWRFGALCIASPASRDAAALRSVAFRSRFLPALSGARPGRYLVITGGRVLDPETGLDAVRDVGVVRNEIVAISREVLQNRLKQGGVLLEASGKVVSPGFIDLHAHGQSTEANRYQAMDGVTTALELEDGVPRIGRYLESRAGTAIVHYGASARHQGLRLLGIPGIAERAGGRPRCREHRGRTEP